MNIWLFLTVPCVHLDNIFFSFPSKEIGNFLKTSFKFCCHSKMSQSTNSLYFMVSSCDLFVSSPVSKNKWRNLTISMAGVSFTTAVYTIKWGLNVMYVTSDAKFVIYKSKLNRNGQHRWWRWWIEAKRHHGSATCLTPYHVYNRSTWL